MSSFFDIDSGVTITAIILVPPINIFLIYRILTKEAVMDNFQKLIICQCVWALLPEIVLFLALFFVDDLRSPFAIILSISYHVWKDTDMLLVTYFSNYWKNIFVRNRTTEMINYVLLTIILVVMQLTGAVAHVTQIRIIANVTVAFQVVAAILILAIHIYCYRIINKMKKGSHSEKVLKGIKKMSKGLLLKGLFVVVALFQISIALVVPVFGSVCVANAPCNKFVAEHDYFFYGLRYTNNVVTELAVFYPLISVLLTWYCVSGLLKREKKKISIRPIAKPVSSTSGTLVPVTVEILPYKNS